MSHLMKYSQKRDMLLNDEGKNRPKSLNVLEPYDPSRKDLCNEKPFDYFKSWQFFEQPGSYMLSGKIVGRRDTHPLYNAPYIFLGRQTQNGKPTVISIPMDGIHKIYDIIYTFLRDTRNSVDSSGLSILNRRPIRTYDWQGDRIGFWEHPEVDLDLVRIGVSANKMTKKPELLINNRIPGMVSQRFFSWPGPTIALDIDSLEKFLLLLDLMSSVKYEPTSPSTPPTPSPNVSPHYSMF